MRKIGNFILGIMPTALYFIIQFVAAILVGLIVPIFNRDILDNINELTPYILLSYGLIGLIVFGLWYLKGFKEIERTPLYSLFKFKNIILVFIMSICYQVVITVAISIAAIFFTEAVDKYSEFMDDFMSEETFSIIFYTVIIAPITEELVFRGVTLNHMKRAVPFWLANIIQALLFGALHMNIVQGTYAFCLGLILGLVYKKYNSLYASIFFHLCINLMGVLLPKLPDISPGIYFILIIFSFFGVVYSLIKILKKE